MGRQASGFVCPKCKDDVLQDITGKDSVRLLELKCHACGFEWAVEAAHGTGAFMSATGKVKPE